MRAPEGPPTGLERGVVQVLPMPVQESGHALDHGAVLRAPMLDAATRPPPSAVCRARRAARVPLRCADSRCGICAVFFRRDTLAVVSCVAPYPTLTIPLP